MSISDLKKPISRCEQKYWIEKNCGITRPSDWKTNFNHYWNLKQEGSKKMNTVGLSLSLSPARGMQSIPITQCQAQNKEEAKETAMSTEMNAVDHLVYRVDNIYRELKAPLSEKFNMYRDNRPKTYKELIDFIKNDKFKLNEKRTKLIDAHFEEDDPEDFDFCFDGSFDGIIWDGPQPDHKGYEKAKTDLLKARDEAYDVVKTVSDQEKRLQALKDFQNWKSETAAN